MESKESNNFAFTRGSRTAGPGILGFLRESDLKSESFDLAESYLNITSWAYKLFFSELGLGRFPW